MFSLTKNVSRQGEILEVVLRNGWGYMRGLLVGGKSGEPRLPSPETLRKILVELGPVYVKLGQLLSTRPDVLPARYIEALTDLQANVPPAPWIEVEALLRQELGKPLEEVFARVGSEAIAAGSIGQVYRATLADGREVALKVQRPGIDIIVAQDVALIKGLAELVSITETGKDFDIVTLADEFTSALQSELNFLEEADYTDRLRENLAKSRWFEANRITTPGVYWELSTPKLLVLEWLNGQPLLASQLALAQSGMEGQERRSEVTSLIFRAFVQQFYIDGFFHADPHPGNIFYLDDGRVALLDCGMVGQIDPRSQQILTELLLAVVDLDAQRCSQLTLKLSQQGSKLINLERLEGDFSRMLRKYHSLNLSQINFSEIIYEALQVARNNKIRLPGSMGLFAKSLANLEGLARGFDPEINFLDEVKPLLTDLFRRQLLGTNPLQTLLRTALDLKSLSLRSPQQLDVLLERMTSETLNWNFNIRELNGLRRSLDDSANRLSFSILVGSLIMGAAIISSGAQTPQLSIIPNILFTAASFLGLWLIFSILRSGLR
ncbi:AarF/ABC1/UbiB kinase family protein [Oscillatoria sp. FACHB-1406]|uniref:ABC1 kinase family protein n=1 Tax=Oscillatoria sp. FACHB-1406 TaxID=2692846 RepID=UPI0016869220|nr:AarF/ABC1/UbiB kinase family protein [Oscillatoria sp. FACHB-1406]MBD2579668.1 AarF/ABC1/UbiB kinase family protein [Oscillatoria sp. FACHB-1406]